MLALCLLYFEDLVAAAWIRLGDRTGCFGLSIREENIEIDTSRARRKLRKHFGRFAVSKTRGESLGNTGCTWNIKNKKPMMKPNDYIKTI